MNTRSGIGSEKMICSVYQSMITRRGDCISSHALLLISCIITSCFACTCNPVRNAFSCRRSWTRSQIPLSILVSDLWGGHKFTACTISPVRHVTRHVVIPLIIHEVSVAQARISLSHNVRCEVDIRHLSSWRLGEEEALNEQETPLLPTYDPS